MPAVGPGTSIGGRYHLRQRLDRTDRVERWEADDTRFGRRVWVTVLADSDPAAEATLDAARRASSLTDTRLLPILDAAREDKFVYVVEEALEGAVRLTEILSEGPLRARVARRVVGAVADVLDRAASRGLHHLALTPDMVLRARDGSMRLRGLAVQSAIDGHDEITDAEASRTDAVALVTLLHAALTATWAGAAGTGLRATPTVAGHPAAPSELVSAVPDDLEQLVVSTLSGGTGQAAPTTPGAVAELLRDDAPVPGETVAVATADAGSAEGVSAIPTPGTESHHLADDLRADIEHPPSKAETAALAAAGATAAGARAVGLAARDAARRAAERRRERAEARGEITPTEVPFAALAQEAEEDRDPVAPVFVNDIPTGTPSSRQANFVLALMSMLVVVGLVLGVVGIVAMVRNIEGQLAAGPVARTYTATAPAVTVTVGPDGKITGRHQAAPSPAQGAAPVAIVGVSTYDPEGSDDAENNSTVNNVRDGNPTTYWRSQRYKTDTFGGLKSGVGLAVFLGDTPVDLHQLKLVLPDNAGQDITVYGSDRPGKEGAKQLGTVKGGKGDVTVDLPGADRFSYVVVWFTNSPEQFGGHYAALSELSLS